MQSVPSILTTIAIAVPALCGTGCSAVSGVHEAETEFIVKPGATPGFKAWSEIYITEDPKSVTSAELLYVRLEARDEGIPDLTFIQSIAGAAKVDETFTPVAEKNAMPKGERIVPLDLTFDGDVRQLFYARPENDDYAIHIAWSGMADANYPIPADGIWMIVRAAVRIDD